MIPYYITVVYHAVASFTKEVHLQLAKRRSFNRRFHHLRIEFLYDIRFSNNLQWPEKVERVPGYKSPKWPPGDMFHDSSRAQGNIYRRIYKMLWHGNVFHITGPFLSGIHKLLNKRSCWWWFEAPWRSRDVTLICYDYNMSSQCIQVIYLPIFFGVASGWRWDIVTVASEVIPKWYG